MNEPVSEDKKWLVSHQGYLFRYGMKTLRKLAQVVRQSRWAIPRMYSQLGCSQLQGF